MSGYYWDTAPGSQLRVLGRETKDSFRFRVMSSLLLLLLLLFIYIFFHFYHVHYHLPAVLGEVKTHFLSVIPAWPLPCAIKLRQSQVAFFFGRKMEGLYALSRLKNVFAHDSR